MYNTNNIHNFIAVNVDCVFMSPERKHKSSLGPTTKVLSQPRRNIVGCRIQHVWKEGGGHVIWKGTVLDQVTREPSNY